MNLESPVLRDIRAAIQEGRWGVAIRLIERSKGGLSNTGEMEKELIRAYIHTHDFDAAVDAGEKALKDGSPTVRKEVLPTYADALLLNGLFPDALATLRDYVTLVGPFSDEELGGTYRRIELIESGKGPEIREQVIAQYGLPPSPLPEPRIPLPPIVAGINHKRARLLPRYPGAFLEAATPFNAKAQYPYHVFLSYHYKDGPLVRRVAERLMTAGVRVWFFEYLAPPAEYYRLARIALEGMEQCACVLLFTSPEYAKSAVCEQEVIWAKQRFQQAPDRILEVTLDPAYSVRDLFQLPEGAETVKWRRPAAIEAEKEAVDIVMAALQPYTRIAAPRGPAWPWQGETGTYRARTAPVRIDTCGLRLERWEVDARSAGDQVRFSGQGDQPLSLDLRFSFALSQADVDNIFPTMTDSMDDRSVYQRFVAFAERHIRDWSPLWAKLKQGGIHLTWANGRPHFAFTYCTGRAWIRRYFVVLTDPALPRPVEVVFTFSVPGTPDQAGPFLVEAARMDRIVQSTNLLHLKEFRQLRAAVDHMEAGMLDRAVSEFQAILAVDQEWPQVWLAVMQAHMKRREWAEAATNGWRARGLVPDSDPWKPKILFTLGDALILSGNPRDARMMLSDCMQLAGKDPTLDSSAIQMRLAALESSQAELLAGELVQRLDKGGSVGCVERVLPAEAAVASTPTTAVANSVQRGPEFSRMTHIAKQMPAWLPGLRRILGGAAALAIPGILVAVFLIRSEHGTLFSAEGRHLFGLLLAAATGLLAGYNGASLVENRVYDSPTPVPFLGVTISANVLLLAATLLIVLGVG